MKKRFALGFLSVLAASSATAQVVINEVEYDENATDTTEFIELYNAGGSSVDISGYKIKLYNGSTGTGVLYTTVTIPAATSIAAGGYYVVGCTAVSAKNQAFALASDNVQNGAPDSLSFTDASDVVLDAFAYEGGGTNAYTGPAGTFEGNVFKGTDATTTAVSPQVNGLGASLGRYPDGADTGDNTADFHIMPMTPQAANQGTLTLPYSNTFDTVGAFAQTANPPVYNVFVAGVATPTNGQDIVALPLVSTETIPVSPDSVSSGSALRIRDLSGGGCEYFFGGAGNTGDLTVTGYWYLKQSSTIASETSGISLKNTKGSGFFGNSRSTSSSFGYESGVSVTYTSDGTGTAAIQGIPTTEGTIKVDSHTSNPEVDTNLANTSIAGNQWVSFRISVNFTGNRFYVEVNGSSIYDGAVPSGVPNRGGVTLGYRESGTIAESNGAFFDAIQITSVGLPVEMDSYSVQ